MNVYEVDGYWIAAKGKEEAYWTFLEEENNLEDALGNGLELHEGDEDSFTITIRRLTTEEINKKDIPCCEDGCDDCQENDHTYFSLQDLLDSKGDASCVLAKYS